MRNCIIATTLLMVVVFAVPTLLAQTTTRPPSEAAIPALSGIWEAPSELNALYASGGRSDICDEGACGELLELKPLELIITIEEPQMLPWAEERYKATRQVGGKNPDAQREDANPWFSACTPASPAWLMLDPFIGVELRQFPDVVFLFYLYAADHSMRRVYVDGRGHPPNFQPTWMGHSVGKYEGDTLVVDTIGMTGGDRWLDFQGHPQSDALHLVERIRRVDQDSLEFEVTVDDPKAYKNSWSKKIVRELALPGPRIWGGTNCEELLQMGTHYGAEARQ